MVSPVIPWLGVGPMSQWRDLKAENLEVLNEKLTSCPRHLWLRTVLDVCLALV